MKLVDSASAVEAPDGFERIAWARLEPHLDANRASGWRVLWFPQWALAGGVAALLVAAFWAGRMTSTDQAPAPLQAGAGAVADVEPGSVLRSEVGTHLDRTQMMLVELVNTDSGQPAVFAGEQRRAADLVAVNRIILQSARAGGRRADRRHPRGPRARAARDRQRSRGCHV